MADFNALETLINAYIKKNGVQAITGNILNGVLRGMVSALGKGYTIIGVANPSTDPGTMTGPCAYYASKAGIYTNFGGLRVNDGEVAMLIYDEQNWHKEVMFSLEAEASVDANVGTPWVNASFENGMLTFTFGNMKGNPGDAAGFGTVTASVDSNIGTPGVSVQTSGPDTAKNMTFQFTNLKGETGVTSVVATVDNTTGTPACAVSLNGQELHLDFTGLKGAQGNTGVSADYPITIVNNLTDGGAASALSAEMGKQLESEISQLDLNVDENENGIELRLGDSVDITNDVTLRQGYIERNGTITAYSTWYYAVVFLKKGNTISISNTNIGSYPSLGIASSGSVGVGDVVTVLSGKCYTASADTWIVISAGTHLNSLWVDRSDNVLSQNYGEDGTYEAIPVSRIAGKYPNSSGSLTSVSSAVTSIFDVSKLDYVLVYNNLNSNLANYGILFSTDNTFASVTHGFAQYEGVGTYKKIVVPKGATYMAVDVKDTNGKVLVPFLDGVGNNNESIGKIVSALPCGFDSPLSPYTTLSGYPSTSTGMLYEGAGWTTRVYDVDAYNYIKLKHHCNNSVYGIALTNGTDLTSTLLVRMLSYDTNDGQDAEMFIDVRGVKYLSVYASIDDGVYNAEDYNADFGSITNLSARVEQIDKRFVRSGDSDLDSTIAGCYPRLDQQTLYTSSGFNTEVYDVTGVQSVLITCQGVNTTYYGIAFSEDNETFDSSSVWKSYPGSGTYSGSFVVEVPAGKTYMAIDKATTKGIVYYIYDADVLAEQQGQLKVLNKMFVSGYYGKKCIYIGDSISTADSYYWKGLMESKYNIAYVRDSGTYVHPADGGVPVIPPTTEPESRLQKSIWYRCSGNNLGNYTFDFISLFGGTNDMNVANESDISLGSISDTPYVDTLTGFSVEKAAELTATRPATLTFASALMGCIEMLHRDFPDKPIFLGTVMPCYGSGYGNTVDANNVRMSERMAKLQMQIAAKYNGEVSAYASSCNYGVTAVPFYWNVRTYQAAQGNVLSQDGVHPNYPCGRLMADFFARMLDLR